MTRFLSWSSEPEEYLLLGKRQFALVKQWQSYWKYWDINKYSANFPRGNLSDWMLTFRLQHQMSWVLENKHWKRKWHLKILILDFCTLNSKPSVMKVIQKQSKFQLKKDGECSSDLVIHFILQWGLWDLLSLLEAFLC